MPDGGEERAADTSASFLPECRNVLWAQKRTDGRGGNQEDQPGGVRQAAASARKATWKPAEAQDRGLQRGFGPADDSSRAAVDLLIRCCER